MVLKIKWDDASSIQNLIDKCYFDDNNGVLRNKEILTINNEDVNYKILKGLDCTVKVSSSIIDGHLSCLKQEDGDTIKLKPISVYCVNKNPRYSFY